METKEIQFHKSMNIDKRNPDFCYLRKNAFNSRTPGLYPSSDFQIENPDNELTSDMDIMDILGDDQTGRDKRVIVQNGNNIDIYDLGSGTLQGTIVGVDYEAAGVGPEGIRMVGDDDWVYQINQVNDNFYQVANSDLGPGYDDAVVSDGLYYYYIGNNGIKRQLDDETPVEVFTQVGFSPEFSVVWNEYIVLFRQLGSDIFAYFWDKEDNTFYAKRIQIRNARLIAAGSVDGRLMVVKSVGNSTNAKEREGMIVVDGFNGEYFEEMNAIKAGDNDVEYENTTSVDTGNKIMVVALNNNKEVHNETLYQDWVLKIHRDGEIEVLHQYDSSDVHGTIRLVRIAYNYITLGTNSRGTQGPRIFTNENRDNDYDDYQDFNTTSYVTNFMEDPFSRHQLKHLSVAFEKMMEQRVDAESTGEKLKVSYRTSEREDFIEIGTITSKDIYENVATSMDQTVKDAEYNSDTTGMTHQIYDFIEMSNPDLDMPEFSEIQFKFELFNGMSIIKAWYGVEHISRNSV